ncbi:MAG: TlpA family protein disulfide reductase [Acidobacteria bacterium]|nr:TlpA family protein disulfide reductase [Acidobacteriota bacterium]
MKKTAFALLLLLPVVGCGYSAETSNTATADVRLEPIGDAPAFDLPNVAGGSLNAEDYKGKVVVIDLWATWCAPCIKEIPMLNELHTKYAAEGDDVKVIALTVQSGSLEEIKPYVEEFQMKYPVAAANEDIEEGFGGILGFPTTFVVGKDWKIYKRILGSPPNKKELLEKDIAALRGMGM